MLSIQEEKSFEPGSGNISQWNDESNGWAKFTQSNGCVRVLLAFHGQHSSSVSIGRCNERSRALPFGSVAEPAISRPFALTDVLSSSYTPLPPGRSRSNGPPPTETHSSSDPNVCSNNHATDATIPAEPSFASRPPAGPAVFRSTCNRSTATPASSPPATLHTPGSPRRTAPFPPCSRFPTHGTRPNIPALCRTPAGSCPKSTALRCRAPNPLAEPTV